MRSIGAKIFFAFFAVCVFLALYGVWSVRAISSASDIVKDTYDRPLQAINFARSAHATFYRARLLRLEEERLWGAMRGPSELLVDLETLFLEDLAIAEERSMSDDSRAQIQAIRAAYERWLDAEPLADGLKRFEPALEEGRAAEITEQFDLLIETMATDSFLERQRAVDAVDRSLKLGLSALAAALLAAAVLAYILGRTIVRPLAFAAEVANKISQGDFRAEIPHGAKDETGALLASMRVMQDSIHQMMAREEARRKSAEARMAGALESADAAVILLDRSQSVIYANSRTLDCLPEVRTRVEAGAPLFEALEAAELSFRNEGTQGQSLIAGLENADEIQLADDRWLKVSRAAMSDDGVVIVLTDVTDLKEREKLLKIATAQAEAANRAKTRFLSNISHELKTPLNSIIGFSEIINKESFGPVGSPQYKEYADYILSGGRRLLDLVKNVLDIAREADGELEVTMAPVNLDKMVLAAVERCRPAAEKAAAPIAYTPPEKEAWVWGELERLERALDNVLSNAVKFGAGAAIDAFVERDGSFLVIRVRDHGIGMKPEEIPIALSAFDQVDGALARRFEGAGVGLAFVKAVIESHGGRVEIRSAPGMGAEVSLYLLDAEQVAAGALAIPSARIKAA